MGCLVVLFGSFGCGASYQSMYEGEVRFEHCYRLDAESKVPSMQRHECWREWNQFYTYGQSRDRIEYARRRERELGASSERPVAQPNASAGVHEPLAGPAPTSAFEPPPKVHVGARDKNGPQAASTGEPKCADDDWPELGEGPPGQGCLLKCAKNWRSCKDLCQPNSPKCKPKCDSVFRTCVARCV